MSLLLLQIKDLIGTQDNDRLRQKALWEARLQENHVLYLVAQDLSGAAGITSDLLFSPCFRKLVDHIVKRLAGEEEPCPVSVSIVIIK